MHSYIHSYMHPFIYAFIYPFLSVCLLVADTQHYKRLCPSVRLLVRSGDRVQKGGLDTFYVCLCMEVGVGCPCPPIRNDIVTLRHLFFLSSRCPRVVSGSRARHFTRTVFFAGAADPNLERGNFSSTPTFHTAPPVTPTPSQCVLEDIAHVSHEVSFTNP